MNRVIDLNADLGEECGDDAALMPLITSANVACGLHAGGPLAIRLAHHLAMRHRVTVGAHPSYPDRANFGRVSMSLPEASLRAALAFQMGGFEAIVGRPAFVKAHGALYNDLMANRSLAALFMDVVFERGEDCVVVGLPGSALQAAAADHDILFIAEAFADRAYLADGTLAPRTMEGAVLHDPEAISARAVRMVTQGEVETIDGKVIEVVPDTLCVHGDTPAAVEIARAVRSALTDAGVTIQACA